LVCLGFPVKVINVGSMIVVILGRPLVQARPSASNYRHTSPVGNQSICWFGEEDQTTNWFGEDDQATNWSGGEDQASNRSGEKNQATNWSGEDPATNGDQWNVDSPWGSMSNGQFDPWSSAPHNSRFSRGSLHHW
jgi:hypothetical protein